MKDKKQTIESVQAFYQTGSTNPPKNRGGIIAFLLVLVIFLSGIVTALSVMNIRLFRALNTQEPTEASPVVFSRGSVENPNTFAAEYPLGFSGQEVSDFWQTYRDLPAGIYVVEVTDHSSSLLPGDILTRIGDTRLQNADQLRSALTGLQPGDRIDAIVYRGAEEIALTLTLQED